MPSRLSSRHIPKREAESGGHTRCLRGGEEDGGRRRNGGRGEEVVRNVMMLYS